MIAPGKSFSRALPLLMFCGAALAAGNIWRERLNQAERLSGAGKNEEAVKAGQGVLAEADANLGPEAPEIGPVLTRLGRIYERAQDGAKLPEMERRLSAIRSKDAEAWLVLGEILRQEGKSREAAEALKKALALKPDDPESENALAQAYDDLGRFEEEVRLLKKRIDENPRDYPRYSRLADAYARLGRSAEVKETFARARKINGRMAQSYIDEGFFDLNSGESARAKEDFENAIAVDTSSPFGYHHMGAYFAQNRQFPEAEKYFRRALELLEANPNSRPEDFIHIFLRLGYAVAAQGRPAEAEAVYRKCLEKPAPGLVYVQCLRSLAKIYVSQNKPALAEETLQRAAAGCEEGPACSCRGYALLELGNVYLDDGRRREAADMANQAAKFCADSHDVILPTIEVELAGLYGRLGDISKEEVFHARVMAMRSSNQFLPILPAAAEQAMTRGRYSEAEDLYREGIRIVKNLGDGSPEAAMLEGLAAACEKQGKPQEAAEAREQAKALRTRP